METNECVAPESTSTNARIPKIENLPVSTDGFASTSDVVIVNTLADTFFFSVGFGLPGNALARCPSFPQI